MDNLSKEEIFRLLSDSSTISKQEIQLAYEAYIDQTTIVCMTEKDNSKVFRILHHQILMFESLQNTLPGESGGAK